MAYIDFTLSEIESKFGIKNIMGSIFPKLLLIEPSEKLIVELAETMEMPIKSEKAKSEWIVVPILKELRYRNNKFFTIYSGENLNADKENGLTGECDFILTKDTKSFDISVPIIQIVEAKRIDNRKYYINNVGELLAAFQSIIDYYKGTLK